MLSSLVKLYEENPAEQNEQNIHIVSTILSDVANSLNDSYRILNNTVCKKKIITSIQIHLFSL